MTALARRHTMHLVGRLRRPEASAGLATAVLGFALAAFVSRYATISTGDYAAPGPDGAGRALAALSRGDLAAYVSHQPVMGLASLLLRLPITALVTSTGGNSQDAYALGTLTCLLPCVAFVTRLAMRVVQSLLGLAAIALGSAIILAGPASVEAIRFGHPEELLAAVLACAAVIAATRERSVIAPLLLGLAVGTKQWTLIAALPVLAALSRHRLRAFAVFAAGALALTLPAPLADPAAFTRATHALGATRLTTEFSAWWPLARVFSLHIPKSEALPLACGLAMLAAAFPLAFVRRDGPRIDWLALLAVLGLVRCLGDPSPVEYYFVAVIIPVAVWEMFSRRRLPVLALVSALAVSTTFNKLRLPLDLVALINLGWTGVLGAHLTLRSFGSDWPFAPPGLRQPRLTAPSLRRPFGR